MTTEEISRSRISVRLACRLLAHHAMEDIEALRHAVWCIDPATLLCHIDGTHSGTVGRFEIGPDGLVSGCELMGWLGY